MLLSAAGGGELPAGGALVQFAPLIVIFVIFYFLLIRPQQKKQQTHRDMLQAIKRGDKIVTTGGVHGTVEGVSDATLQLKISNQVKIKISRSAVAGLQQGEKSDEE
ncbi:MAG: preprotein translocase subunit YajC [bacterium]|nr:preprotein translocase subunit YajC [bacterium]